MAVLAERRERLIAEGTAAPLGYPESYWRSLQFFNLYRLVIGLVLCAGALFGRSASQLGSYDRTLFIQVL